MIFTERPVCGSCLGVVDQFQHKIHYVSRNGEVWHKDEF